MRRAAASISAQSLHYGLNDALVEQHACFDRLHCNVASDGFDLGDNGLRQQRIDPRYPQSILSGNAGEGTGAVNPMKGKGAQIGLNACPTTAVRASNGEGRRPRGWRGHH